MSTSAWERAHAEQVTDQSMTPMPAMEVPQAGCHAEVDVAVQCRLRAMPCHLFAGAPSGETSFVVAVAVAACQARSAFSKDPDLFRTRMLGGSASGPVRRPTISHPDHRDVLAVGTSAAKSACGIDNDAGNGLPPSDDGEAHAAMAEGWGGVIERAPPVSARLGCCSRWRPGCRAPARDLLGQLSPVWGQAFQLATEQKLLLEQGVPAER